MFNPAIASEQIKKDYIGYISTTYHFRNQQLQDKLVKELKKTIAKGPFVDIKDSFKSGKNIDELITDGVLSPLFRDLEKDKPSKYKKKLPLSRSLYLHQEKSIEKIVNNKNVVVSTGTGSGKTFCFMIPVINELLREKEAGTLDDGVRAIFIYPMNALANDQIKTLREILMSYPDIRFGVYNGGTENDESKAIKLYEAMFETEKIPELRKPLPNEELSREAMKKRPPHILFTNYAMLEHLLFRPGDDTLFSNSHFKFVVLDEAHVYTGATGIETSFLIGRLRGRINGNPQFILTSATLGDGSPRSNEKVVSFARSLTGCTFNVDDIVTAYRDKPIKTENVFNYSIQFYTDLANEENSFEEILNRYSINVAYNKEKENEILYDILSSSDLYNKMRYAENGKGPIELGHLADRLEISQDEMVAFIALCSKAEKCGKPLVDIRYHYFIRALDGCYMALDYPESLSLIRKNEYITSFGESTQMFEIAVCENCGETAIVGSEPINGRIERAKTGDDIYFYQIIANDHQDYEDEDVTNKNHYVLCKNCGAIVPEDEYKNAWCKCGNCKTVKVRAYGKGKCVNCNGTLRPFNLGYDAATSVVATSLYEQIPEYTYVENEDSNKEVSNIFLRSKQINKKLKSRTGSQFLVFSDSRQGAAKFACFLDDMYKQFLRRRGIWNLVADIENDHKYRDGLSVNEFVELLENYYEGHRLFRKNNSEESESSAVENRRNAWVAILDELYNCNRDTSLVSLGKISFEYIGNDNDIIKALSDNKKISATDAKNYLNYLAFEVIKAGAISTKSVSDINDSDREYLFFTPRPLFITKFKDTDSKSSKDTRCFMPTEHRLKNGEINYYRSNKLNVTKNTLGLSSDNEAVEFLGNYWDFLVSKESNNHPLVSNDNRKFVIPTSSIKIKFGENATLWKCDKCGKVSQFNIGNKCIKEGCSGKLERLNSKVYCKDNYYANLYQNKKIAPLFIKEHTAQLAKKEALDYQQQFIRKELNALSCSTTFEMGVDVGDLETVFLRNIPPLPSNYAQRVGRAGRSISAAAFALTFARLSSHDFTFFDNPREMIEGKIYPPSFSLENEKILRRHVYAVAIGLYLLNHPDEYSGNNAKAFINDKGYEAFLEWLKSEPKDLSDLLHKSFTGYHSIIEGKSTLYEKYIDSYAWLDDFCGDRGIFKRNIDEYESDVAEINKEIARARKDQDYEGALKLTTRLNRYSNNELIDFLARRNILPKYGFPIDTVELSQNISSKDYKSLNLNRDLSVAIAEYAPSSEVVADGGLYTSRYIKKPIINRNENDFDIAYIAECQDCHNVNYSKIPVGSDGRECAICGNILKKRDFRQSIEPRAGFIAEENVKDVPLRSQERKYKTEAIYIGDPKAYPIKNCTIENNGLPIAKIESTGNDSLVVKSTDTFFVCSRCGYSLAEDSDISELKKYEDYKSNSYITIIEKTNEDNRHSSPFGRGKCGNTRLVKYFLHHEFKTDVAKISFSCDTSDNSTMLSVMYALLNSFAVELNIERRDIKACLTYKKTGGKMEHKIIIYDAVPGGAGHSRRLVTDDGDVFKAVVKRAIKTLETCECSPSCYRCLRNYENQKIHEILDRMKALEFLKRFGF